MTEPNDKPKRPDWARLHLWEIRGIRDLFWIALVLFLIWFGYELRSVFTPVLIGFVFAYLFHPLISAMERRYRWPRPATISAILAVGGVTILIFALWLGPQLVGQVAQLARNTPGYLDNLAERYEMDLGDLKPQLDTFAKEVQSDPAGSITRAAKWLMAGTGGAIDVITDVLSATTYILLMLLLIPVYFFFFAWTFGPMVASLRDYIPDSKKDETLAALAKMDEAVGNYFRDRVIISFIMAVMFAVGWAICGVPYWLLLAIVTGLLSLIPYAAVVGWLAALLLKTLDLLATDGQMSTTDWIWGLGGLTLVYAVVQVVEGWLLTPWIQGKSLNMSSVTILIVVFIGGAIGGMYGLILCIPVAACLKIVATDNLLPRFKSWCAAN